MTRGPGRSILLVEDDEAVAEMYRGQLVRAGHRVRVATNGVTALEVALTEPLDLMLLDVRLPGLDGMEVLARVREDSRTRGLRVVVLSSYSAPEIVRRGVELGALEHLLKTQTTPSRLCERVDHWCSVND